MVGGSLTGIATAIALARRGFEVSVLERAQSFPHGAGLGIDLDLLRAIAGVSAENLPVVLGNRLSTSWNAVHAWLSHAAARQSNLSITHGVDVQDLRAAGKQVVLDTSAGEASGGLVVGADGYRSTVRRFVDPQHPCADFAGYMLWRGMCEERRLPPSVPRPDGYVVVEMAGPYRLVAYAVPGVDGSVVPGERQISWAWYDPSRREFLERNGCVVDNRVVGTLRPADITPALLQELKTLSAVWPTPWREAIVQTLRDGDTFATPIAEYVPRRLSRGRVAIAGDAAHVASPMTGSGLRYALQDVLALGRCLDASSSVETALDALQSERLEDDQLLVLSGRSWGRSYLAAASRK